MKLIQRRILSLILALILCGSLCFQPGLFRAEAESSGACGENGDHLRWSFSKESGILSLSGSGAMRDYLNEAPPWNAFAGEINALSLPEGMTKIGASAFSGCRRLQEARLPASVTVLGRAAFSNCSALTKITLRSGLTEIRQDAFCGCEALVELDVPATVTKIGSGALADCAMLRTVSIRNPKAVLEKLFEEEIASRRPECLTIRGFLFSTAHAFAVEAGQRFSSLGSCTVSATAKGSCGNGFFWELDLRQGSLRLNGSGAMEDYRFALPPWRSGRAWIRTVKLEVGITEIGGRSFADCAVLRELKLPAGLKRIGPEAFASCKALQTLTLPQGLEGIDCNAFDSCTMLQSIQLPDTLKQIREMAFCGCSSLRELSLPDGLEQLGANAFMGCSALRTVVIPGGVRRIPNFAFASCSALNSVSLQNGVEEIGAFAFSDCPVLERLQISGQLKTLGVGAFSNCTRLRAVSLPESLREIRLGAFRGCMALRQIVIRSVDSLIGTGMQDRVDSAENLELPEENDSNENLRPLDSELAAQSLGVPGQTKIYGRSPVPDGTRQKERLKDGFSFWDRNSYCSTYGYAFYRTDSFSDVTENEYYEIPVAWAKGEGITQGVSDYEFGPDQSCARGQVVTFLWRTKQKPVPVQPKNPFKDVKPGEFYYSAVLWALQVGVTNGTSPTEFSPDQPCTRGQVVTFLWRAMGCREPSVTENPFVDAEPDNFYYRAMLWALENNITNGTDSTHFSPDEICTRGQVVTFLYRTMMQ